MLAHTQSESLPADRRAVSSISKTDYILWRSCAKNAWLRIHKPDVYYSTEVTEFEQSVMAMGIEVERVARGLFPDGVAITSSQTDGLDKTRSLIASKTRTLFQPVFKLGECLALIDVLQRELGTDEWSIYEVKSATNLKNEYIYDLAFQAILLRKHGIVIKRAFIILLNANYVRRDDLDYEQLFNIIDATANLEDIAER
jgi:predicted RecB family nuclease